MPDVKGDQTRLTRQERARATRRRIVQAATDEFCERGYHGTTMAAIAEGAGVAVQTVYFVFNTKPDLLTASIDSAVLGEHDMVPEETDWWRVAMTARSRRRAIAAFVSGVVEIEGRAAYIDEAARVAATTDPDIADLLARNEARRVPAFRAFVDSLAERGLLAPAVDARRCHRRPAVAGRT